MYQIDQLKAIAPAAFRTPEEGAKEGVSKQYQFMTTSEIIKGLSQMGWNPYGATQQKSKKNVDTAKHMIRFRNNDFGTLGVKGNVPEILFVNSHDGSCSLKFHIGIFRIICSNGLVVADKTFGEFKVRHMGTNFDDVNSTIIGLTEKMPTVFNSIDLFERKILSEAAQKEFAMRGLALRYPEYMDVNGDKVDYTKIQNDLDVNQILKVKRSQDNSPDLWSVYNRVQEHLIGGEFMRIGATNKSRSARPITNIRTNMIVNQGLWNLAEEFVS